MRPLTTRCALRGARLLTLRRLEGLTQGDLAHKLGVTQSFVSHIEKGLKAFPLEVAAKVAAMYNLPIEFFSAEPSLTDEGFATFRKSSKATIHDENRVVAMFGEAARLFQLASEKSGYHGLDLDSVRDTDAEVTANNIRSLLGLSADDPLLNATRAAERLGVGVIHGLMDLPEVDHNHLGISRPNPFVDRPLVATIGTLPPALTRMTVLHELGHVIYDRDRIAAIRGTRSLEEKRAFRFASAMMLPAHVVRKSVTESLPLRSYLKIKADYGISVSAIIVRAASLGVISPKRERTLMIQMSSNGWRHDEPVLVAEEHPILLAQAVRRGIGSTVREIAVEVGISYATAARWTGLPMEPQGLAEIINLQKRRRAGHPTRSTA